MLPETAWVINLFSMVEHEGVFEKVETALSNPVSSGHGYLCQPQEVCLSNLTILDPRIVSHCPLLKVNSVSHLTVYSNGWVVIGFSSLRHTYMKVLRNAWVKHETYISYSRYWIGGLFCFRPTVACLIFKISILVPGPKRKLSGDIQNVQ